MEDNLFFISSYLTAESRLDEIRKQKDYERNHQDEIKAVEEIGNFTGYVIRNLFK